MPAPATARRWLLAVPLVALMAIDCQAIEMFTFFGDGSRIGLPSLEVPVEAYPGIPLRSDRLRARRRALRMGPAAAAQVGTPGYARGITIRSMPATQPAPAVSPRQVPPVVVAEEPEAAVRPTPAPPSEPLVAPEPDDVGLPTEVSPPSGS